MLKLCELLRHLRQLSRDNRGVVSLEYLIVAASLVAIVSVAFGAGGPLQTALTTGLNNISTAITNATAPAA
jgi:Flp pilus assembly pilin Flp